MDATLLKEFLVSIGYSDDVAGRDRLVTGVLAVTKTVLALGTAVEAASVAVVAGVAKISQNLDELYYASIRTRASAENIQAFSFAVARMGGTAEGARGSLEALGRFLRTNPMAEGFLRQLGIQTRDARGQLVDTTSMVEQLSHLKMDYWQKQNFASMLGIDERTLMASINGVGNFMAEYKRMLRAAGVDLDAAAKSSRDYMNSLALLQGAFTALGWKIAETLGPRLRDDLEKFRGFLVDNMDRIGKGIDWTGDKLLKLAEVVTIAGIDVGRGIDQLIDWFDKLDPHTQNLIKQFGAVGAAWLLLNTKFLTSPAGFIFELGAAIFLLWQDYDTWVKSGGKEGLIDWGKWKPKLDEAARNVKWFAEKLHDLVTSVLGPNGVQEVLEGLAIYMALRWPIGILASIGKVVLGIAGIGTAATKAGVAVKALGALSLPNLLLWAAVITGLLAYKQGMTAATTVDLAEKEGFTEVAGVDENGLPTAFRNPTTRQTRSAASFDPTLKPPPAGDTRTPWQRIAPTWLGGKEAPGTEEPAPPDAVPGAARGALGPLIARGEGGYNTVNLGQAGGYADRTLDLTHKTLSQVIAEQEAFKYNAAGRYQIIRGELRAGMEQLHLTGNELFNEETQDRLFEGYLLSARKRPALNAFLHGQTNNVVAANMDAAREFASVARPDTGQSYYAGVANNRASISPAEIQAALWKQREITMAEDRRRAAAPPVRVAVNVPAAHVPAAPAAAPAPAPALPPGWWMRQVSRLARVASPTPAVAAPAPAPQAPVRAAAPAPATATPLWPPAPSPTASVPPAAPMPAARAAPPVPAVAPTPLVPTAWRRVPAAPPASAVAPVPAAPPAPAAAPSSRAAVAPPAPATRVVPSAKPFSVGPAVKELAPAPVSRIIVPSAPALAVVTNFGQLSESLRAIGDRLAAGMRHVASLASASLANDNAPGAVPPARFGGADLEARLASLQAPPPAFPTPAPLPANQQSGNQVSIMPTTTINVSGASAPEAVASLVRREQTRVYADMLRNTKANVA